MSYVKSCVLSGIRSTVEEIMLSSLECSVTEMKKLIKKKKVVSNNKVYAI